MGRSFCQKSARSDTQIRIIYYTTRNFKLRMWNLCWDLIFYSLYTPCIINKIWRKFSLFSNIKVKCFDKENFKTLKKVSTTLWKISLWYHHNQAVCLNFFQISREFSRHNYVHWRFAARGEAVVLLRAFTEEIIAVRVNVLAFGYFISVIEWKILQLRTSGMNRAILNYSDFVWCYMKQVL